MWFLSSKLALVKRAHASLLDKNHIYESKLTNGAFFISGRSGGFTFSISAQSDNFEILALCSAKQKVQKAGAPNCEDLEGWKIFSEFMGPIGSYD